MSQPEQPPPGGPEHSAEHTVRVPPETPEETTQELPAVAPPAPHQPEHQTVGLPLLDLLAPQQTAQQSAQQAGPQQAVPQQTAPPAGAAGPAPYPEPYVPAAAYSAAGPYRPADPYAAPDPYGPAPHGYGPAAGPRIPGPRRGPDRRAVLLVGGLAAVVLLAIIGVLALRQSPPQQSRPGTTAPQTSAVRTAGGYQFTQHAARTDTDCAANAYGKVIEFFQASPCSRLERALYGTTVDGRLVVVSVSVVHMPDEAKATELRKLVDTSGTGNVNDLLRAGVRVPGGPAALSDAGYASRLQGAVVVIAESDFADQSVRDQGVLDRVSTAALQLRP